MNRLLQLLSGRTIAIVGNGNVSKDFSSEIDSADVVVRFNHFYNYDSGNVGKRVEILFQTPTLAWVGMDDVKKHVSVIREQRPQVYLVRNDGMAAEVCKAYGSGIRVNSTENLFREWSTHTTGTAVLSYLASNLDNAKVSCYGFQDEEDWERYISTDARKYSSRAKEERIAMLDAIARLEALTITDPYIGVPQRIVIPVKASSSGAPGKNRKLLKPCIEEALKCQIPVSVVGDDGGILHEVGREYGIDTYSMPNIRPMSDVTDTLYTWAMKTGYSGDVALVQCTSPYLMHEWIEMCMNGLNEAPLTATCCELGFKPTSLFCESYNRYVPWACERPAPSVARQILPHTVRLTGAVFGFHTDALAYSSLFYGGYLRPVIVPERMSLDVDTEQNLQEAMQVLNIKNAGAS